MAPWLVQAMQAGELTEPDAPRPTPPHAAEQILRAARQKHTHNRTSTFVGIRKPAGHRQHVGLSRFQFGDGEFGVGVSSLQKHTRAAAGSDGAPRPEMCEVVPATRTLSKALIARRSAITDGGSTYDRNGDGGDGSDSSGEEYEQRGYDGSEDSSETEELYERRDQRQAVKGGVSVKMVAAVSGCPDLLRRFASSHQLSVSYAPNGTQSDGGAQSSSSNSGIPEVTTACISSPARVSAVLSALTRYSARNVDDAPAAAGSGVGGGIGSRRGSSRGSSSGGVGVGGVGGVGSDKAVSYIPFYTAPPTPAPTPPQATQDILSGEIDEGVSGNAVSGPAAASGTAAAGPLAGDASLERANKMLRNFRKLSFSVKRLDGQNGGGSGISLRPHSSAQLPLPSAPAAPAVAPTAQTGPVAELRARSSSNLRQMLQPSFAALLEAGERERGRSSTGGGGSCGSETGNAGGGGYPSNGRRSVSSVSTPQQQLPAPPSGMQLPFPLQAPTVGNRSVRAGLSALRLPFGQSPGASPGASPAATGGGSGCGEAGAVGSALPSPVGSNPYPLTSPTPAAHSPSPLGSPFIASSLRHSAFVAGDSEDAASASASPHGGTVSPLALTATAASAAALHRAASPTLSQLRASSSLAPSSPITAAAAAGGAASRDSFNGGTSVPTRGSGGGSVRAPPPMRSSLTATEDLSPVAAPAAAPPRAVAATGAPLDGWTSRLPGRQQAVRRAGSNLTNSGDQTAAAAAAPPPERLPQDYGRTSRSGGAAPNPFSRSSLDVVWGHGGRAGGAAAAAAGANAAAAVDRELHPPLSSSPGLAACLAFRASERLLSHVERDAPRRVHSSSLLYP